MSKVKLNITCHECDNHFQIQYDDELAESIPTFCPFCCEYISEDDESEEYDQEEYEDDEE